MIQQIPHTIKKSPDTLELRSRDPEVRLVDHLSTRVNEESKNIDRELIKNIYISLKTKPLLVLTGLEGAGKAVIARVFMETLNGGSDRRMKQLVGHPWWVNGNENSSMFIEAQTRINSDLLKEMIGEASCEENHRYLYLVCLSRISPGELATFFADIAFQMNHGYLVSLPTLPLPAPVLFPPNFVLLATMDSERSDWMDEDLLAQGQIVYMHQQPDEQPQSPFSSILEPDCGPDEIFLSSRVRDHQRAFSKLHHITRLYSGVFAPVMQVANVISNQGLQVPSQMLNNIVLYLANA
jgi:hypothetical protein